MQHRFKPGSPVEPGQGQTRFGSNRFGLLPVRFGSSGSLTPSTVRAHYCEGYGPVGFARALPHTSVAPRRKMHLNNTHCYENHDFPGLLKAWQHTNETPVSAHIRHDAVQCNVTYALSLTQQTLKMEP